MSALMTVVGCGKKPTPTAALTPEIQITLQGKTAGYAIAGVAGFDVAKDFAIELLVGCETKLTSCALALGHVGGFAALHGCRGGRLINISFSTAGAKLRPGSYSQDGVVPTQVSITWSEGGELRMTADNWADPIARIEEINEREVRVVLDAHYVDGSIAVKGRFSAPICK